MSDAPTIKQTPDKPGATTPDAKPDQNAMTLYEATTVQRFSVALGQRFGEYELLTEIARGGMGVVYRARHVNLDRVVALKMILAGRLAHDDDVARFRTEAEAAARLQHQHIVAVFDVGEFDGQHYFTMEFIDGISLDQKLAHGPLACKVAARYVRLLARAVHYAHKQGILHRDLKPSNILIDHEDEPHITDFGLAKRLGPGDSGQTRSGAILGTPSYMSPEQAQGKIGELGPAADVYSLGAILYELVTGRPPFRADTPLDTVLQVIEHDPVPPRLLNPKIDHDLETICLKCLEKDPTMRYASAEELGEDLQRYLNGDTINARSFNVIDRIARTLEHDTHTADFSAWSSMILTMAAVVFAEHITVFFLVWFERERELINVARFLQLVSLAAIFWYHRRDRLMPTNAAERELWTIWIGYFTTYFFIIITTRMLTNNDTIGSEWIEKYILELLPYPFISLVSGMAFFIMGSNYWGRCYAIGAVFFLAAPMMALDLRYGPLIFGVVWTIVLLVFGWHLHRQGLRVEQERATPPSSQADTILFKEPRT